MGKKVPFWQFFRMGWDGHALLGRPSRIPHSSGVFSTGATGAIAPAILRKRLIEPGILQFTRLHLKEIIEEMIFDIKSLFKSFVSCVGIISLRTHKPQLPSHF